MMKMYGMLADMGMFGGEGETLVLTPTTSNDLVQFFLSHGGRAYRSDLPAAL